MNRRDCIVKGLQALAVGTLGLPPTTSKFPLDWNLIKKWESILAHKDERCGPLMIYKYIPDATGKYIFKERQLKENAMQCIYEMEQHESSCNIKSMPMSKRRCLSHAVCWTRRKYGEKGEDYNTADAFFTSLEYKIHDEYMTVVGHGKKIRINYKDIEEDLHPSIYRDHTLLETIIAEKFHWQIA